MSKRDKLRELSKLAKNKMQLDCEGMSVNEILIQEFYTNEEHQIFKTFHDWKKEDFFVKKGETAFLIWGKPKALNKKEQTEPNEDETEFFPICFLFSNAQVKQKDA